MRLTTKGRFAVTAMIDLAMNAQYNAVKLNAISERQKISLSYLEQLFSKLRRAGLVESIRGPGGGYILGKSAEHINIAQIIAAAEDSLDATLCSGKANCQSGTPCLTHNLWENLNQTIHTYLSSVTLASLLEQSPSDTQTQIVKITHIHV
ncbi:Fe-S cluster assembly transcriptional regulator IscR [Wielerella bovis]|uniref:Fe-S cluster assembly transcriptional regulator IscR n=1 Tax=Wielerella bovis TaxID=2917790 RepID=UPI002019A885|nr:Fe-S cluster assembly transcriptional regulator IscR [Wielerella bovis]MCG7656747.1 Fe-S cluster assembly transcriptional regulator IscR [Wielerella bovis]MCG7658970.1 Fe-S cluster assembly transcriptional regulator IscR [Wielerella bovis]ULJ63223.1 Fe-S cluster assembly transcriptional regulator IscR [Wielerella bovis]ULJ70048.1 Fe-S cluster assembly transcriptional regulator IscR [Wielerella bovis]